MFFPPVGKPVGGARWDSGRIAGGRQAGIDDGGKNAGAEAGVGGSKYSLRSEWVWPSDNVNRCQAESTVSRSEERE